MFEIEPVVDSHSHKAFVGQHLAALLGVFVVAFAAGETTSKDIEYGSLVGARVRGLVDVHFQVYRIACSKNKGLLGL